MKSRWRQTVRLYIAYVKDVAKYYLTYKDDFEIVRAELSLHGAEYPMMKLMDMCMWQVAFEKKK